MVAEYDPDLLKNEFTRSFELYINFGSVDSSKATELINGLLHEHAPDSKIGTISSESLVVHIPYRSDANQQLMNYSPLINSIEELANQQAIHSFRIVSNNLDNVFNELVVPRVANRSRSNGHVHVENVKESVPNEKVVDEVSAIIEPEKLSECEVVKTLLKKRFLHFKRNYRLILSILILPTLFEMIAMGFMTLRPPGEYDIDLQLSRALYSNSTDVYSIQNADDIDNGMYESVSNYCDENGDEFGNICRTFNTSEHLFRWVLNTTQDYPVNRYGGISINGTRTAVWYNNNGYHSMPVFLNELNTAYFRSLMNDSNYKITTNNYPLKLDEKALSTSSM